MVDEDAQLYTIEGVAAGILMIFTAYLVFNSAYVLTPGDTHISDMQLEQLGNDVLTLMDTPLSYNPNGATAYENKLSPLEEYIRGDIPIVNITHPAMSFEHVFKKYADDPRLKMRGTVYYRNDTVGDIRSFPITTSDTMTGREHYVRVNRWVHLEDPEPPTLIPALLPDRREGSQTVLLEVLLWRD